MPLVSVPVLSDGVVTLRGHREEDVPGCLEQSTDPVSMRWTRVRVPYGLEDARRFVRETMPGGWATDQEWGFAVEAEADGSPRYAGTVSLRNQGPGRAEVAYGAHPWARGRGIVERALRLLLAWGFSPVEEGGRGLETVIWWAERGNWASRKVAWRVGFGCDGTLRRWLEERDGLVDCWAGTLTRDDPREPRNPWLEVPKILGENVTLRVHRDDDLLRVLEAGRDERTAYWLGGLPQPYTDEIGAAFLRDRGDGMARGADLHWMIADPETDLLLGTVSIMGIDAQTGPEIGYWAHPAARGRGVMTEAVRLACRHAFVPVTDGGLGLPKLRLVSAVDNTASRRVAEANGFREIGIERLGTRCRDGWHDTAIYDLLAP
jgi:RimJ/RimL family protein N-acetyltransferase